MSYLKRIMISVTRRKFKSLLLILCTFILGSLVGASYLVKKSSNNMIEKIYGSFKNYSIIRMTDEFQNYNFDFEEWTKTQDDLFELYNMLSENKNINDSNLQLVAEGLGDFVSNIEYDGKTFYEGFYEGSISFMGVEPDSLIEKENFIEIIEGRNIQKDDQKVIVIPEEMHYENGEAIQIGDHLTITYQNYIETVENDIYDYQVINSKKYDFEVIGRCRINDNDFMQYTDMAFYDLSIVPFDVLKEMRKEIIDNNTSVEDGRTIFQLKNIIFELNTYENNKEFKEEFMKLNVKNPFFKLITSDDGFSEILGTLENIKFISNLSLIVSVAVAAMLGMLIIYLYLKDKKQEIGILLSMGEKKKNIFVQLFGEVFLVGMLGILLSLGSGGYFGNKITNNIIGNQLSESIEESEMLQNNAKIDMEFDYYTVLLAGGGMMLIVSTIYPIYNVIKLKPKDIFSGERL